MSDIRCPNCGRDNPDFLDVCQFCQTPLQAESSLQIGDSPTKKNTGELEAVLPDWLKDARQQSRDLSATEDAMEPTITSKLQKDTAPDLLAGLINQSASDDDEVPDWLAELNPVDEKKSPAQQPAAENLSPSDFFSQFEKQETTSPAPASSEPVQDESPSWMGEGTQTSDQNDELGDWLSRTSDQPADAVKFDLGNSQNDEWKPPAQEPEQTKEPEDLSWLHNLEASSKQPEPSAPQTDMGWASSFDSQPSSGSSDSQEDLSWLNNLGGSAMPASDEPAPASSFSLQDDDMSWLNNLDGSSTPASSEPAPAESSQGEDLSWLNNLGGASTPASNEPALMQSSSQDNDLGWLNDLGGVSTPTSSEPAHAGSSQGEDLGWLNNLSAASNEHVPTQSGSSQDDLSWLNDFGSSATVSDEPVAVQSPAAQGGELDWLNNLGDSSAPAFDEPVSAQPTSSKDDLSWLGEFGSETTPAFEDSALAQPASTQENADWLNNLGNATTEESAPIQNQIPQSDADWLSNLGGVSATDESPTIQPFAKKDDLDWLNNMGQQPSAPVENEDPASPFVSRGATGQLAGINETPMPDWLKSATEEPSMPPPGEVSMDWFKAQDEEPPLSTPEPASAQPNTPSSDVFSSISNQDVDSMFAMEMPDWLSQRPSDSAGESPSTPITSTPASDSGLAPVELPSWVQAMRPVESVIDETSANNTGQLVEREGPLAGFQGLIPSAPIGSSRRPKAVSLKLQATDEQQANAALLEQIIAGETTAHAVSSSSVISSQHLLRIGLTVLFLLVLGTVVGMGSQNLPVVVPPNVRGLSDIVATVPDNSPVLVVMDYQPSMVGEMEAASGALLDQMALSRHAKFTFLSTSPNGSALVERLLNHTNINKSAPDGLGYQLGDQYSNVGFLPGDSVGILAFVDNPNWRENAPGVFHGETKEAA